MTNPFALMMMMVLAARAAAVRSSDVLDELAGADFRRVAQQVPPKSDDAMRFTRIMNTGDLNITGFRVPGFVATHPGVLHVFAEARHNSCNDASMHSLAYARSSDGGATFSPVCIRAPQAGGSPAARGREPRPPLGPMQASRDPLVLP